MILIYVFRLVEKLAFGLHYRALWVYTLCVQRAARKRGEAEIARRLQEYSTNHLFKNFPRDERFLN